MRLGLGTNAASRRLQWCQRCIRSHLGQAGHPLLLYKCTVEFRRTILDMVYVVKHETMQMTIEISSQTETADHL